jgi:hypothetical protein
MDALALLKALRAAAPDLTAALTLDGEHLRVQLWDRAAGRGHSGTFEPADYARTPEDLAAELVEEARRGLAGEATQP